jgi:signal transduction histidine kinase
LFRNLRVNIFAFYFLTVVTFLSLFYYVLEILDIHNIFLFAIVVLCFVILSGVFISKLAVDPLQEYVKNLQNLSKETLHELNLPISTIITNTQMLRKSLEGEKNFKRIERVESACNMLKQRYNELDYLIKMQTKQEIKEKIFVNDIVKQRIEFLQKIYPNIEYNLNLIELEVFTDKTGLSKVIDNLIDNGIKYSGNSKKIDIKMQDTTLFIQDYGVGMDEVALLKIFDNYYQVNKDMQGFGIGLSMVKRFCDENGVELTFDSSPDVGTTVKLKFKKTKEY